MSFFYRILILAVMLFPGLNLPGFTVLQASGKGIVHNNPANLPVKEVGGLLEQNTIWYPDTMYLVTDNILITQDITLEVEAGTTVKFNQGRGVNLEGGRLLISGLPGDSVYLLPNHPEGASWNWFGISLNSVSNPGDIVIEYAVIEKAIQGIRGQATYYGRISNCRISNSFFMGIVLSNSSFWEIEHNKLIDNFLGIEIIATGQDNHSLGNEISNNLMSNEIINVSIQANNLGAVSQTTISDNMIKNGEYGIWLFSSNQEVGAETHITRNIFKNNGLRNDGYGIYVSMDSVFIERNLFWRNYNAVGFSVSSETYFHHNSLYQNTNALTFRSNSVNKEIRFNTFSQNLNNVANFFSWAGVLFQSNNIFHNVKDSAFVINHTPFDIDITGNHWGNASDSIIQTYLFDQSNVPHLGKLLFQPISEQPYLNAPISPPHHFISQFINGENRLLWKANPEANTSGYRIFYGDFQNYSFSDSTAFITDTVFTLPSGISGKIAIAAYNEEAQGSNRMFQGHKSPYSFVQAFPFAGMDTVICSGLPEFKITGSSIPEDFTGFEWATSGDGQFDDPMVLNPSYFPGDNDKIEGRVTLTLLARSNDTEASDSFELVFAPVPYANAGENGFSAPGQGFTPINPEVGNATDYFWETLGDGFFMDPDSVLTTYFPGEQDNIFGKVYLVLHAVSAWCEPVSDTMKLLIKPRYSMRGRVWGNGLPTPHIPVIATMIDDFPDFPLRFITFTDANGYFEFESLFQASYLLYTVPEPALPFWPAYYVFRMRWEDAFVIDLTGHVFELDIFLFVRDELLPLGEGSINGHFELPDFHAYDLSVYCQSWLHIPVKVNSVFR